MIIINYPYFVFETIYDVDGKCVESRKKQRQEGKHKIVWLDSSPQRIPETCVDSAGTQQTFLTLGVLQTTEFNKTGIPLLNMFFAVKPIMLFIPHYVSSPPGPPVNLIVYIPSHHLSLYLINLLSLSRFRLQLFAINLTVMCYFHHSFTLQPSKISIPKQNMLFDIRSLHIF